MSYNTTSNVTPDIYDFSTETSFETVKTTVQYVSFVAAVLFNTLLIILIVTRSPKKIGSYKYLMVYFCCFAIFFSCLDIVLQPYILSVDPGFIVVTRITGSFLGRNGEITLLSSLCGCFGFILSTIAIHFVFRYFALERKGKLKYFKGDFMVAWLSIPFFVSGVWTLVTVYFCYPSTITMEYSRTLLKDHYDITLEKMTYIGAIYYVTNAKGEWEMNNFAMLGMAILFSIMGISISILLFFASKCYSKVKKLIYEGDSSYTKHLQQQLYKALVAQATIPMFFIFLPIGLYLTFPLVGIKFETMGKIATFIYAMYPALDPLPIIFIIDNYRIAILDFFGCSTKNRINIEPEEVTSVSRHVSHCS